MPKKTKKPARYCSIHFDVTGYVEQIVEILNPKWTAAKIEKALQKGTLYTTVQEGSTRQPKYVRSTKNGHVVAEITYTITDELEFTNFTTLDAPKG